MFSIDFGTTHSGLAYCHVNDRNNNIFVNNFSLNPLNPLNGAIKTNTVIQYDKPIQSNEFKLKNVFYQPSDNNFHHVLSEGNSLKKRNKKKEIELIFFCFPFRRKNGY